MRKIHPNYCCLFALVYGNRAICTHYICTVHTYTSIPYYINKTNNGYVLLYIHIIHILHITYMVPVHLYIHTTKQYYNIHIHYIYAIYCIVYCIISYTSMDVTGMYGCVVSCICLITYAYYILSTVYMNGICKYGYTWYVCDGWDVLLLVLCGLN